MPTNQELQARIAQLEKEVNIPEEQSKWEDRVWEAVMIGAISTLFDPTRINLDTPKALNNHIARALRVADEAVKAARNHRDFTKKENKNDPLLDLLPPTKKPPEE